MRGHRAYLDLPEQLSRGRFYVPTGKPTPSQATRSRGPILAMDHPKRGIFSRIVGRG